MKFDEYINEKKVYVGDCTQVGDEDYTITQDYFSDATEMAQTVEKGKNISKEQFMKDVSIEKSHSKINGKYFKYRDMLWIYDDTKDIHYFYA